MSKELHEKHALHNLEHLEVGDKVVRVVVSDVLNGEMLHQEAEVQKVTKRSVTIDGKSYYVSTGRKYGSNSDDTPDLFHIDLLVDMYNETFSNLNEVDILKTELQMELEGKNKLVKQIAKLNEKVDSLSKDCRHLEDILSVYGWVIERNESGVNRYYRKDVFTRLGEFTVDLLKHIFQR